MVSFRDHGSFRINAFMTANAPATRARPASPRRPEASDAAERLYTISALASEFALTTRAIRFYEDEGLVAPRRHGQARIYGERERTRIKLILRGKRLGLTLAEIREILDLYDSREGDRRQLMRFLEVLDHRRRQLEVQRSDIDALLDEIGGIERDCRRRLKASVDGAA
jgi:DNA-binding transcriptional MerR regulator